MTAVDELLAQFDEAKQSVRCEIRESFLNDDDSLRVPIDELWRWIGERAIDELKIVMQLSFIIGNYGHRFPVQTVQELLRQAADEARHYEILRSIIPDIHQLDIDEGVEMLPAALLSDSHWQELLALAASGDPYTAVLDINIVHEGFSAAAIEELKLIPDQRISAAYEEIGEDEVRHHESGRDMLEQLLSLSRKAEEYVPSVSSDLESLGAQALWGDLESGSLERLVADAHKRQRRSCTSQWSWPPEPPE